MSRVDEYDSGFDDAPQWYWAVWIGNRAGDSPASAGERFVVASGQGGLWRRARGEFGVGTECNWMAFGPKDGKATLADCAAVFLFVRECYGVTFNRMMLELAQVPAWANFVDEARGNLCDYVSNPSSPEPLPRGPYERKSELALQRRIVETLGSSRRAAEYED